MRTAGSIICILLLAACSAPQTPSNEGNAVNSPPEQPAAAVPEPVSSQAQPEQSNQPPQSHPCLTQEGESVTHKLKALGTEPFWAAEVDGRCITYKTPEDQAGTRVWTHVDTGPQGPVWNGALRGRQFQLIVKPAPPPGCSDGMSDKTYPMDAELRVDGEIRKGCAQPT
ncbi:MAG TPA: hypothetical protein VJ775_03520 [Sphingomicrobium sp.]|nr:hypothetical protein [Sphingomicrobium sp.]